VSANIFIQQKQFAGFGLDTSDQYNFVPGSGAAGNAMTVAEAEAAAAAELAKRAAIEAAMGRNTVKTPIVLPKPGFLSQYGMPLKVGGGVALAGGLIATATGNKKLGLPLAVVGGAALAAGLLGK